MSTLLLLSGIIVAAGIAVSLVTWKQQKPEMVEQQEKDYSSWVKYKTDMANSALVSDVDTLTDQ